jgi:hypothetical protein
MLADSKEVNLAQQEALNRECRNAKYPLNNSSYLFAGNNVV